MRCATPGVDEKTRTCWRRSGPEGSCSQEKGNQLMTDTSSEAERLEPSPEDEVGKITQEIAAKESSYDGGWGRWLEVYREPSLYIYHEKLSDYGFGDALTVEKSAPPAGCAGGVCDRGQCLRDARRHNRTVRLRGRPYEGSARRGKQAIRGIGWLKRKRAKCLSAASTVGLGRLFFGG